MMRPLRKSHVMLILLALFPCCARETPSASKPTEGKHAAVAPNVGGGRESPSEPTRDEPSQGPSSDAGDAATSFGCHEALTAVEAKALLEEGLCKSGATFLGRPVCEDLRAFERGGAPRLSAGSIAVGATFRVEQARNGRVMWSEANPLYAVQNAGTTDELTRARVIDIHADNEREEQEALAYVRDAFERGEHDRKSGLYQYIAQTIARKTPVELTPDDLGGAAHPRCQPRLYLRGNAERLYLLISSKHSNAWEYDSHPVLYLAILSRS